MNREVVLEELEDRGGRHGLVDCAWCCLFVCFFFSFFYTPAAARKLLLLAVMYVLFLI